MSAEDLTLNIAVNLGRVSRWAMEGKRERIEQFLKDTDNYINLLESAKRSEKFEKTFKAFKISFNKLRSDIKLDGVWAEEALTWANILTHRAKLA